MRDPMADDRTLAERLLAGDKRALARGISLVEDDDPEGWALVREVYPHTGDAAVVGFTGPPGAGKTTLIGALIRHQRRLEREVAVLSIDPSSPFRGGALLGDRIRLTEHFLDPGVYIRSMATRGALGRLDPGAQGRRDGDPRHHRRQQGRPPAHRHDGARDPRRPLARPAGGLAR